MINYEQFIAGSCDDDRYINSSEVAKTLFSILNRLITQNSLSQPNGPFLGLGAGSAQAEISLATLLNLQKNMVLVDKEVDADHAKRGNFVESDLFDFLETAQGNFGVITALGIEYILRRKSWKKFWLGIDRVSSKGTYILIYSIPNKTRMPVEIADKFEVLYVEAEGMYVRKL